ncbi:hypothetical protein GCG21_08645 [Pseudactinotalea sp. HY160]|uniref:hypothetical protein n=1 Tax=Pseudactinotalea sp. HY160 TaxID=2654490 RepID=UPI00128D6004|nr:hypothetical protein [Pseudactinotalea sp. HY160]MPV50072.1 hypothetical protein [Pseudactinotalea sp. HY160]
MKMFRRYVLEVIETRQVPNTFARGYGDTAATSTGYRAVDQFGDEWCSDWHSSSSDGYGGGRMWICEDGRTAWEAKRDGSPARAGDGWILQGSGGGA